LQWLEIDIGKKVETVPPYVLKGNKLLDTVTKQIPGLLAAHLLLAKGKLGAGEVGAALKHIERVIEINNKHMEASILYALISFQVGNTQQAFNCLEEAVANNFQVRENPLFMLVKGEIELKNGNKEAALQTLEVAYNLPGGKAPKKRKPNDKKGSKDPNEKKEAVLQLLTYGEKERCKLHILLARAYIANGRVTEAKNIMDEAIKNFAGTTEEANVLMTNAELAVASNDIKKAISILKAVDKSSSYFVESRKLMADIYLKHMMDRRHYAQSYVDIIEASPTYENYKLLGDALMKIQEPEDASKAYREALKLNPNDDDLIRLIGKALMATHDYNEALNYYEDYLKKDPGRHDLRLDMGKLCIQLGKFDKADQLLKVEIFSDEFSAGTLTAAKRNVEGLLQIAKLGLKRAGKTENPLQIVKETYVKAISMQAGVIEKAKQEAGNPVQERNYLAEIQYELGKYFSRYEKNQSKALELFESAWKVNNTCERYLLAMAETHMKLGDRDSAEMRCIQVLKLDPYNQYACLLISDLMMLKGEAIKAIKQFLMVLEYNSSNYLILSKLIDLMFRNGRGDEVKPILDKVQKQCPNSNDPGLCYCKGIYHKLSRSPAEALEEFFKSKKGNLFAEESIIQMVDLYLNPDQDLLYNSIGESGVKAITPQNLNAADNLIKELKNRGSTTRGIVAEAYVYMFQKNKMELAQTKLTEILKVTPDYVPALTAFVLMRLIQGKKDEAKKILASINQKNYSHEHGDDIEEAWLLYADFCISVRLVNLFDF
jgi:tetratricopeptide repeat protein 21B